MHAAHVFEWPYELLTLQLSPRLRGGGGGVSETNSDAWGVGGGTHTNFGQASHLSSLKHHTNYM